MSLNAGHISPELILFALLNYIAYAILCLRLQTCRKIEQQTTGGPEHVFTSQYVIRTVGLKGPATEETPTKLVTLENGTCYCQMHH